MRSVLKFLLFCLLVGLVLAWFDITPQNIVNNTVGTVRDVYRLVIHFGQWAVPYVLLGAVVVVPVMVIGLLLRTSRR